MKQKLQGEVFRHAAAMIRDLEKISRPNQPWFYIQLPIMCEIDSNLPIVSIDDLMSDLELHFRMLLLDNRGEGIELGRWTVRTKGSQMAYIDIKFYRIERVKNEVTNS